MAPLSPFTYTQRLIIERMRKDLTHCLLRPVSVVYWAPNDGFVSVASLCVEGTGQYTGPLASILTGPGIAGDGYATEAADGSTLATGVRFPDAAKIARLAAIRSYPALSREQTRSRSRGNPATRPSRGLDIFSRQSLDLQVLAGIQQSMSCLRHEPSRLTHVEAPQVGESRYDRASPFFHSRGSPTTRPTAMQLQPAPSFTQPDTIELLRRELSRRIQRNVIADFGQSDCGRFRDASLCVEELPAGSWGTPGVLVTILTDTATGEFHTIDAEGVPIDERVTFDQAIKSARFAAVRAYRSKTRGAHLFA